MKLLVCKEEETLNTFMLVLKLHNRRIGMKKFPNGDYLLVFRRLLNKYEPIPENGTDCGGHCNRKIVEFPLTLTEEGCTALQHLLSERNLLS